MHRLRCVAVLIVAVSVAAPGCVFDSPPPVPKAPPVADDQAEPPQPGSSPEPTQGEASARRILGPFPGRVVAAIPAPDGDRLLLHLMGDSGSTATEASLIVINTQEKDAERRVALGATAPGAEGRLRVVGWQDAERVVILRSVEPMNSDSYTGRVEVLDLRTGSTEVVTDLSVNHPLGPDRIWLAGDRHRVFMHFTFLGRVIGVELTGGEVETVADGLPTWDGHYGLEPAPDGTAVALPDRPGFLNLESGRYLGPSDPTVAAGHPAWSPKGSFQAYAAAGLDEGGQAPVEWIIDTPLLLGERIDIIDRSGVQVASFRIEGTRIYAPRWLPDGRRVAFRELLQNPDAREEHEAWFDGRLWIGDVASGEVQEVPIPLEDAGPSDPIYGPLTFSRDGRWAYFSQQGPVVLDRVTGALRSFQKDGQLVSSPGGSVAVMGDGILLIDGEYGVSSLTGFERKRLVDGPPPGVAAAEADHWYMRAAHTDPVVLV